jgi:transposase
MLAAGGAGWVGDATTRREFPPLRASWAKRGQQRAVVMSGRTGRRVIPGALTAATGEVVDRGRARRRQDDGIAFIEHVGQGRPDVPKRLIGDNAPPHHPKRVLAAAAPAQGTIAWLPFRAPELNPLEDRWRLLTAVVAATRVYGTLDARAAQALAWLAACLPATRLTRCGLRSSIFDWLPT